MDSAAAPDVDIDCTSNLTNDGQMARSIPIDETQSNQATPGASFPDRAATVRPVANPAFRMAEPVAMAGEGDRSERDSMVASKSLQPVASAKKSRNLQPVAGKAQTKQGKRLRPKSMTGHLWKPDGLSGWSLYRRQPAKSKNGKNSSKQKYVGYYSQETVERLYGKRKKTAKS